MDQTSGSSNTTYPGVAGRSAPPPFRAGSAAPYPPPPPPPPPISRTLTGATSVIPLVRSFRFVHEPVQRTNAERFVGRQHELTAFVERVLFSNGGSFLVTGYRGVGKTSFINQALNRLEEVIRNADAEFGHPIRVVPIALNIARPVQPAELMHYIVRRLYDRLVELDIYPLLDADTRDALKQAYDRTSFNMARKLSEASERTVGVSDAGLASKLLGVTAKLSLGAKRTSTQNYEMTFLGYDDRAAEHDIITISRRLQHGYVAPRASAWQRLVQWFAGSAATGAVRTELKIIFVFDELDKLEEFSSPDGKGKPVIDDILGALKNLFTTSGVTFVFVAGKDLQERWLEDVGRGDSVYESVFSYDKYLPCMWQDTSTICDHLVDVAAARDLQIFDRFKSFLSYKGRGIPRRIVRTFNEYVAWEGAQPALQFTREQLGRIRFFAGLQDALEESRLVLFGDSREEGAGTQSDKRRLGVYYLVDWMMRQTGEFTLSDVVNASRRLSGKIALAEEIAPRVIEDVIQTLLRKEYLQEAHVRLDKVVIGAPNAPAERRYSIPPRRIVEMGGSSEELVEDSRILSSLGRPDDGEVSLTSIGKYRILETIGSGGMGIVYRATDVTLGRIVAIKTLQKQLIGEPAVHQRFEREARVMSELSHPHVVRFLDAGVENGRPFIVMEYLEGMTLERVIETLGKVSLDVAVAVIRPVASAVAYIHDRGIVRNDLKPANIMLTSAGKVCLLDFGISKFGDGATADATRAGLTITGQFVGTPRFMSPEQFEGKMVDSRSDIYSLGVILYRLLTRVYPFDGENPFDIYMAMRAGSPPPPSHFAQLPEAIDRVVLRCLAFDRDARYASVGEFLDAMTEAAGGEVAVDLRQLVDETRGRADALDEWGSESTAVGPQQKPTAEMSGAYAAVPVAAPPLPPSAAYPAEVAPTPVSRTSEYATAGACARCGHPFTTGERFCTACGSVLTAEASAPAPAPVSAPDRTITDEPTPGPAIGRPRVVTFASEHVVNSSLVPEDGAFLLKPKETTVGRAAQNDIVLLSPAVSRYHGRFLVAGADVALEDYGSSNGCRVNGEVVQGRRPLAHGDMVDVGDIRFQFLA